ncbi:MAG: hypothetical protein WAM81_06145 [Acidimicrobiia bacterium]
MVVVDGAVVDIGVETVVLVVVDGGVVAVVVVVGAADVEATIVVVVPNRVVVVVVSWTTVEHATSARHTPPTASLHPGRPMPITISLSRQSALRAYLPRR